MDSLVVLIPLLPLLAALVIGIGHLCGILVNEDSEAITAKIALAAHSLSFFSACYLLMAEASHKTNGIYSAGSWLDSEQFSIPLNFVTHGFRLDLAALFAFLMLLITRFSHYYMHREAGFYRFFSVLSLFSSAIFMLVLSANLVGTFIGWELAGVCSYLMIAYSYCNPTAAFNATRAFVTNRIGEAGFILGIALTYAWIGSINWVDLNQLAVDLEPGEANLLTLCFVTAAFAKSAQVPFAPWLSRAMEGPVAANALLYGAVPVHTGIFLVIVLQPLFEQSVIAMTILVIFGLLTAGYGYMIGLTQTDINSSLSYAIIGQLGLMFAECGLGFWQFASWHLSAHAIVRCYQLLNSPGFIQKLRNNPMHPAPETLTKFRWAYVMSLQGFWLDPLIDWALVHPTLRLSKDLGYFDEHIIDAAMGTPAPTVNALSSLAQLEEQKIGAQLDNEIDEFARGSGLAGSLTASSAGLLHWFEERLVIRGIHEDTLSFGQRLGHIANKIEQLLIRPRYLSLFVFITLLAAF